MQDVQIEMEGKEKEPHSTTDEHVTGFTFLQLFKNKSTFRDVFVGSSLAFAGIVGNWSGTEWSPTIIRQQFSSNHQVEDIVSYAMLAMNVGSLFGHLMFGPFADKLGRKPTFFIFLLGSAILTSCNFPWWLVSPASHSIVHFLSTSWIFYIWNL